MTTSRHSLLLLASAVVLGLAPAYGQNHSRPDYTAQVKRLLSQMTVEEKVGQMTQVTIDVVSRDTQTPGKPHQLDPAKLRTAIKDYHVGSILNVMGSAYSLDNWHEIITQIQEVATRETRLKIPVIYGIDAIHGANYTIGATIFPQHLGMAATWNPELVKQEGIITAYEVRASGIPWNFNPVLDIGRQPLWPRLFETFGEDPHLARVMAVAYVKGLEGEDNQINRKDKVAACLKHYLGYSFPLTGKDRTPAYIPEIMLREYFLPTFQAAIAAGAHTVMVNSSEINGVPLHASHYYLTELLRGELGFQGFVVSDWQDIINLHTRERVAATPKEAVRQAVMAGIDMSMVPLDFSFYNHLLALVREGAVPMRRIDEAVGRILRVKFALGLFDNPYPDKTLRAGFAAPEFRAVALQAARESLILLKNQDNLLPLVPQTRLLVTGPTANKLSVLNSGWTITWQGNEESLYPHEYHTILEALQEKFGRQNVTYVPGASYDKLIDVAAAVQAAQAAQAVVVCLGEEAYCESPGNITDLSLPRAQLELAQALQQTGKPVILVLVQGRPRLIREIEEKSAAILAAFLPGMQGGTAIAEVLAGEVNPSGRLPITYPRHPNDLTLYDHKSSENASEHHVYRPQFPFGYGLSYTTFEYRDLTLSPATLKMGEKLNVRVIVQNTGTRAGREVVQLYLTDLYASVTPHNKRLKRFEKIDLAPGESRTVTFTLQPQDFAFIGRDNKPVVEPGEFRVAVGGLSRNFMLE
ncbi:MAG: glycoside hydrolase family 3 C-terminal domain-containing protein [candidate division KSB1 bacterium]|nr:glycoside hydrolase family 3 C-terminal domain-containing protein [candidate division KSB1 bacterium]MDZ7276263.1 glycoside hydrolase family 3 C-terminal domain-containing protein [candidate division KSB1 bacterium]MDZ7287931.1 glycoside hydrolase family 3 C-terminal domain-containing protein [candidate division KSB1 bacterium]MDZ7300056.1 glycoside hydrolase family 3 C-terminal domain-containing protein [candidate division KSB1 bacterium]MDZ7307298.1 glycoside hydrolase family 3 C-terminal 